MAYIDSNNIKVFPSVGRNPEIDADAELMNEGNISNIVRSLCRERKSYVLNSSWAAPFEFVIYGFYFKILDISSLSDRPLYAHITLKENTGNYQLLTISNSSVSDNSLQILDQAASSGNDFQGILFDNNPSGGTYTLQLLDNNGNVPATSRLHVKTTEILDGSTSNYISSSFTTNTLSITSNASIGGTLTVSGSTTLNDDLTAGEHTITASTFVGSLNGNADTASNFNSDRTFSFSEGDISGSATSSTGSYTVTASIIDGKVVESKIANAAVTTNKIKDKNVTNDKIADNTIKKAKLGFDVTMTLTVNNGVLIINTPNLEDKN